MNMTLLMPSSFQNGSSYPKIHIPREQTGSLVSTLWELMHQFVTKLSAQILSSVIYEQME